MRLFYAVTLDEGSRNRLAELATSLTAPPHQGRITPAANFHLTLLFVGEVGEGALPYLTEALKGLPPLPLSYRCERLGSFSSIIWASVDAHQQLRACNSVLVERLRNRLDSLDDRVLVPHITLVRSSNLKTLPAITPFSVKAESVALMHSHRQQGILTYTPIASSSL